MIGLRVTIKGAYWISSNTSFIKYCNIGKMNDWMAP